MEKSKILVLVALMLALFLFGSMDVEASSPVNVYKPSFQSELLTSSSIGSLSKTYRFYQNATGIAISDTGECVTIGGGTAVFDLDVNFGHGALLINDYDIHDFDKMYFYMYPNYDADYYYADLDVGLDLVEQVLVNAKPYVIVDGSKHYMSNEYSHYFEISNFSSTIPFVMGVELQVIVSYDATSVSDDSIATRFSYSTLTITRNEAWAAVHGMREVSTGDMYIADTVQTQGNAITNAITEFKNLLISYIDEIEINVLGINAWVQDIFNRLELGFEELNFVISNFKVSFDSKMDNMLTTFSDKFDGIMVRLDSLKSGYDSSTAKDTNSSLSGSLDSWEAAEGETMEDAKIEVDAYDTASAFTFAPALVSSLSLITTFANSFFFASGDLTTALMVVIALVFVSVAVGLVRFVR